MTMPQQVERREPTAELLAGDSPGSVARRLFLATRPGFFPASVAPVIVGSTWGYSVAGGFDWVLFALALLATLLVHLASNVLNDVGDDASGADRINDERIFPYTGGSRFIQNGILTSRQMAALGISLLVLGMLVGLVLAALRGPAVLIFGIIGVALGVLYSLPRIELSAHGVGEAAIAVAFGLLPVNGAAWLQSGQVDWESILISVPVSMWVAAILLINEVPDRGSDGRAGKRTLVVRLGVDNTRRLYLFLHLTASAALLAAGFTALIPWWMGVVSVGLIPGAYRAAVHIREPLDRTRLTHSIEITLRLHTAGCALIVVAILTKAFLGTAG
jgi:1,4-dihydroxy-2-naphthoate octaprenyltransferase